MTRTELAGAYHLVRLHLRTMRRETDELIEMNEWAGDGDAHPVYMRRDLEKALQTLLLAVAIGKGRALSDRKEETCEGT